MDETGFIILRHVNSSRANQYWQRSYDCIRKFHPDEKIVIIDDNSNQSFLTEKHLTNCEIIWGEFPGRGELLPYYYFWKHKFFKKALIIHDSVFLMKKFNFENISPVKFIWYCSHDWDETWAELNQINKLESKDLLKKFYVQKKLWWTCQGVQSCLELSFLEKLQTKYALFNLLDHIKCRLDRMSLERTFAIICTLECEGLRVTPSVAGLLHSYLWDNSIKHHEYPYELYLKRANDIDPDKFPLIKVFTGR